MKKSLKKSGLVLALVLLLTLLTSTTVLAAVSRPDGLWVNNIAINRAELSWNKVSGASGYVVYRRMNSGKYKRIKTIKGRNNCRYEDKGLTKAKSCRYKIKAYKKRGSKIQYSKYSKTVYTKIRKTADLQDGSAGLDVDTIPKTIDEAAAIDGATKWNIFTRITLPLSKPILVYTIMTAFIAPWVDFIFAKVICGAENKYYTVAIGLWSMLEKEYIYNYYTRFCAGAVCISIPIAILFLCTQKYYAEGLSGAVKG